MICPRCNKYFDSHDKRRKYCSDACYQEIGVEALVAFVHRAEEVPSTADTNPFEETRSWWPTHVKPKKKKARVIKKCIICGVNTNSQSKYCIECKVEVMNKQQYRQSKRYYLLRKKGRNDN
jgi:hypothetical protein